MSGRSPNRTAPDGVNRREPRGSFLLPWRVIERPGSTFGDRRSAPPCAAVLGSAAFREAAILQGRGPNSRSRPIHLPDLSYGDVSDPTGFPRLVVEITDMETTSAPSGMPGDLTYYKLVGATFPCEEVVGSEIDVFTITGAWSWTLHKPGTPNETKDHHFRIMSEEHSNIVALDFVTPRCR